MDADVRRNNRMVHFAARDDCPGAYHGFGGMAQAVGICVDELCGREGTYIAVNRPFGIVQVEFRDMGNQVHMGIIELFKGADVTPVVPVLLVGAGDIVIMEIIDPGLLAGSKVRSSASIRNASKSESVLAT